MSKKKLLVTGSGGFIFSNFVRQALKNKSDYTIVSIDKCTDKKVLNTIYTNKGHTLHIGDVADPHFVDVIFELEKPDCVIHGAAEGFVDNSSDVFVRSNIMGTQVIVDACVKHNVKKLIYVSTDEVYGHLKSDSDDPWTEKSEINPRTPYSATKAAGELIVKAAGYTYGLNYNITRSCSNYGPRQPKPNFIPIIIANLLNNNKFHIYGDGMQIRDWIHVQDNCSAILHVLEKGLNGEIYNISSKQEFTNIEVFHEISNILGRGHDLLSYTKDRSGHDFRYSITNDKIKQLGWAPDWKFKDGIVHCIKWYENNPWFIK